MGFSRVSGKHHNLGIVLVRFGFGVCGVDVGGEAKLQYIGT